MIHFVVKVHISFNLKAEAIDILRSIIGPTLARSDCIQCDIYQSLDDATVLMFEELWKSQDALENYIRSEIFSRLLLVIEMATQLPEIRFDRILHSDGLGFVERVKHMPAKPAKH